MEELDRESAGQEERQRSAKRWRRIELVPAIASFRRPQCRYDHDTKRLILPRATGCHRSDEQGGFLCLSPTLMLLCFFLVRWWLSCTLKCRVFSASASSLHVLSLVCVCVCVCFECSTINTKSLFSLMEFGLDTRTWHSPVWNLRMPPTESGCRTAHTLLNTCMHR